MSASMNNPYDPQRAAADDGQWQQSQQPPQQTAWQDGTSNDWWGPEPFSLFEDALSMRARNMIRGGYAVLGVAAVALGAALLFWPGRTLALFALAFGVYFVVSGVVRIVTAIVELGLPGGWRVLNILVGILLAVGGVVVLKNSMLSGQTLALLVTLTVGIGWMVEGITALAESRRLASSGWSMLYAVLAVVAGVVVLVFPLSSTVWLVWFGAIALVVMGVASIMRALSFGRGVQR